MKTGVLGGTFNPIHNSHLYIAGEYVRILGLDRVLFIPTHTPPHKPSNSLVSAEHRLEMCRLATLDNPGFEVCDYEAKRAEKSFTCKTLEYLTEQNPGDELLFLMGADMFLTVQSWFMPERIYACATLCAAAREKGELETLNSQKLLLEASGAKCIVTEISPKPLSSTEIRETATRGEDISRMVPLPVADYILKHRLYSELNDSR